MVHSGISVCLRPRFGVCLARNRGSVVFLLLAGWSGPRVVRYGVALGFIYLVDRDFVLDLTYATEVPLYYTTLHYYTTDTPSPPSDFVLDLRYAKEGGDSILYNAYYTDTLLHYYTTDTLPPGLGGG
jgi:hypothetical protein